MSGGTYIKITFSVYFNEKHLIFISTILAVLLCPRVLGRAYTEAGDGTLNVSAVSADQVRICSAVLLDGFEQTGDIDLKQVVRTFTRESDELVHITVDGEEITCTKEHPFYSPRKGWTAACQLRAGDILVTVNGEYVVVEQVQHEILENPVKVYNFEVEGYHTYYVDDNSLLVHNNCSDLQRGLQWQIDAKMTNKTGIICKNGNTRVPDYLNIETRVLGEAKSVKYLFKTNQLVDMFTYGKDKEYKMFLKIERWTKLSKPLEDFLKQMGVSINVF